jgi:hypothetical protein
MAAVYLALTSSLLQSATSHGLILRSAPKERVSKDGDAAWFETTRFARLLTMRRIEAGSWM